MRKVYSLIILSCLSCLAWSSLAQTVTTFSYTGSMQTYVVPACVTTIYVDLWGAPGGNGGYSTYPNMGGAGGRVQCAMTVTPGQVLNIFVGGTGNSRFNTSTGSGTALAGGYNGGGDGFGYYNGSGGGGTDIRIGGTALTDRKVVAGGGGGASYYSSPSAHGGAGGGTTGGNGIASAASATYNSSYCGAGGNQSSGGSYGSSLSQPSGTGTFGLGGSATSGTYSAGGGGGYYGGGCGSYYGGGGGGSSFPASASGIVTSITHTQGFNHNPVGGKVVISTATPSVFSYTGSIQTYTVPTGVTSLSIDAVGANGGSGGYSSAASYQYVYGGAGGRVNCNLAVTPGQVLSIYVGGAGASNVFSCCTTPAGGYNGGGAGYYGYNGGGGGATDIRTGGTTLADRVIVAGGGGGVGNANWTYANYGGNGGGTTGANGMIGGTYQACYDGTGGSQSAGGLAGTCYPVGTYPGTSGALGLGGVGNTSLFYSGGGGGGYYGGGAGGYYGSGGGGSSYTGNGTSNVVHTQGGNGYVLYSPTYTTPYAGHGYVTITPQVPGISFAPLSMAFGTVTNGATSAPIAFVLTATNMPAGGTVSVTPPNINFEVSPDGITWFTSVSPYVLSYSVANFTQGMFVRFKPTALTAYSGNVTINGTGLSCTGNVAVTGTGGNACSGTPSGITASIAPASGNSATSFTLSVSGVTTGGNTYQWQSAPSSGGTYTDIPGANTPTYTFTGLTANTWYRCNVTCSGTGTSSIANATFVMTASSCTPSSYQNSSSYYATTSGNPFTVTGVSSTSISDASVWGSGTGGSPYYYNNIGLSVTFNRGSSYTATMGVSGLCYSSGQIWIDFDDNGSFTNAEIVGGYAYLSTGTACPTGRPTPVINIPATATPGAHRMRVIHSYNGNTQPGASVNYVCYPQIPPCPSSTVTYYVDTRDYTAVIAAPAVLTATPVANFGNVLVNASSVPIGLTKLTGSNLSPSVGYVTVTAPSSVYQVSTDGVTWGSSVLMAYAGGTINNANLYVQFTPTATATFSGNVTITGGGLPSTVNVAVTGIGNATACSGTPSAGAAAVTPTSGSGNTTFTLSLSGVSTTSNIYYQWQSSPTGSVWTNIADGIYSTYTFTGVSNNMQYRCVVTCGTGASAISTPVTVTYTGAMAASLCTPNYGYGSASCGTYNMWARFKTLIGASGSITDVSSCSGATYDNFTSTYSVTLNAGTTYSSVLECGANYYSSLNAQVFIDFSNNGLFEASESVGGVPQGGFAAGSYVATVPLVIPSGITPGTFRMRLVCQYLPSSYGFTNYPAMNPCVPVSPSSYGNARDYTVLIGGGAAPCSGTPDPGVISASQFVSCGAFTAAAFNVGEATSPGISYQWQSSSSATTGFTNVSGATNAIYNPVLSTPSTVYYRNVSTCANSGQSAATPARAFTYLAAPASITGNGPICLGSNITLASATGGGTWSSSNPAVGTVSSAGVVSSISVGNATVTYTAPSTCITTTLVTVNPQPASITGGTSTICGGGGVTTATLGNTISGGVWSSSNASLATVGSSSGVVSGVSAGSPVITYMLPEGCFSLKTMTVNAVAPITGNASVCIGYSTNLSDATSGGVWTSTNNAVGTVSTSGVVNSISVGSTTISYTVASLGCAAVLPVFVTNPPSIYIVTGGGNFCSGGAGVSVGLSNTDVGIAYMLYNGATAMAGPVFGTGGPINFGLFTTAGSYGVIANPGSPCATIMTGSAVVAVNPLPTQYSVSGGGAYCSGGSGQHVYINSSAIGVNYQLMLGGTTPVGVPVAGTSAAIDFGQFTTAGVYTVIGTNATTGCVNTMSGSVTISINPLPTPQAVTGGGGYCAGGTGLHVFLGASLAGTSYQLLLSGAPVGFPVTGTGSSIDFGIFTAAGTYTVTGTILATGCTANMSGSATIVINPLPTAFNVIGGGGYCSGGTGVAVGLNGSTAGVNYQLYNGSSPAGSPLAGTGTAISFGLQTIVGTYTAVATNSSTSCVNSMNGNAVVSINALPTSYSVTGGGQYCAGGLGLPVGLAGSATGINYQLFCNGTLVGGASGTGGAISFGIQFTAGTYTVVATNTATGCVSNMLGSVTITINVLPTAFTVTQSATNMCAGSPGIAVGLSSSTSGVSYQLYNAGVAVGGTVAGTGSAISFGAFSVAGTYTAVATNPTTTCTNNMLGSAVIVVNPVPSVYITTGGGNMCTGATGLHVGLTSSNTGISYQLMNSGSPVLTALPGTGFALDYGVITTGGTYTIVATNPGTGCTSNMSGSVAIVVNALPTPYPVTGGGNYCVGGSGVPVGVQNSATGINYQLYNGAMAVGSVMPGTGGAINFGAQTVIGSYSVVATNATTSCTNNMIGSVTVGVNALPGLFVVTGGGNYCSGGAGVHIGLSGSAIGTSYQLMNGVSLVGTPMPGTGGMLDFGLMTTAGTYTVVATNANSCTNTMTGTAIINIIPLPTLFAINGGGNYCTSGTGVSVGLAGSATGTNYQLYVGGTPVGAAMAGTGLPLNFGLQTIAGTYTVVATNLSTGCSTNMTGTSTVVINSLPALHAVTGGGNYCSGGTGVNIGLDGSNTGTTYQLYKGAIAMGAAVPGSSGSPINFGMQTAVGIYTVIATNGTTTCSGNMTGSAVVGLNPLPTTYAVTGGGNYCSGDAGVHVGLGGSNSGIMYQLMNGGSFAGPAVAGTGGPLDFGFQSTAGTYTVVANNYATGCTANMSSSAGVGINPLPVLHTVTGGGNYCAGGTGVHIGLDGSNTGTTYQLMNGVSTIGAALAGTGSALDFGLQTAGGTYTVMAKTTATTCMTAMTGSVIINIDPLPTSYLVVGGGNYCSGTAGVDVGLSASDAGVMYQLMKSGTMMGAPITGTGTPISFGLQTAAGSYTVIATDMTTGCVNTMTGSVSVFANPLPTAYTVGGGGNYCAGGTGLHITLSSSASGTTYQLINGSMPIGTPMLGVGGSLDFGAQTAPGAYTVVATNNTTGCTNTMTGSAMININPLPNVYPVSSSGSSYCAGGTGINIWLTGSDAGINYQLYNGITATGAIVPGSGSSVGFGYQVVAGSYSVKGTNASTGCSNTMTGGTAVVVNALPAAFTVTGGGNYCNGGTGVNVGLSGSSTSVSYQLKLGGSAVGAAITGTGGPIGFGLQTTAGIYSITATDLTTGCTNNMTGSANVVVNAIPTTFTVMGGGNYCAGGTGAHVTLSGSTNGVNYQLYRGGLTAVGTPIAGTGAAIDLGAQTTAGSYTIVATTGSSTCSSNMIGSVPVAINAAPSVFPVIGGGSYCPGGTGVNVGMSGSSINASYKLYKDGSLVGTPMLGTGSAVDFGLQTIAGVYTIVASDNTTSCTNNMSGSATVVVSTLPVAYNVVGGGSYCAGGTGVHVGLNNSTTGVNYMLYNGFSPAGTITGTGAPVDFGLKTVAGSYTVQAVNATTGCQSVMTGSVAVTINSVVTPVVTISSTTSDTICEGSFVAFTANITNGGSTPTYQWTVNGAASGVSGTYSYIPSNGDVVSVTLTSSAMCATPISVTASKMMTVDPNKTPDVAVMANPGAIVCQGTSVTYSASSSYGGVAPTFQWVKNGVNTGTSSSYTYVPGNGDVVYCIMTSNYHCRLANTATSSHINMQVDVPTAPSVIITANPGLNVTSGQPVTFTTAVTNGGPAPSYQWSVNGVAVTGATLPSFTSSNLNNNDSVSCQVLSSGGCAGIAGARGVRVHVYGVGVQQVVTSGSDIRLVPNPSKGIFTVKGSLGIVTDEEVTLEVTNMLGQVMYTVKTTARNGELNERIELGSNVANGMYILSLRSDVDTKVFHVVIEQ